MRCPYLWRHRQRLLQMAAEAHSSHMQKSLTLMNMQIHHVLSDITGFSRLTILDGILAGERYLCETRATLPSFGEEPT